MTDRDLRIYTLQNRERKLRLELSELHGSALPTHARARVALTNLLTRTQREREALERTAPNDRHDHHTTG